MTILEAERDAHVVAFWRRGSKLVNSDRERLEVGLRALDESVDKAVCYFRHADPQLYDGYQDARAVLSHLVYWHGLYIRVAMAIARRQRPGLPRATYAQLNARAAERYGIATLPELSDRLARHQRRLSKMLRLLPELDVDFPVKVGARSRNLLDRLDAIAGHIDEHVGRMERASRHGAAWVEAYYPRERTWALAAHRT